MQGKSWPQITKETGLQASSIARILRDSKTEEFMAELRAANSSTLAEIYQLTLSTLAHDLQTYGTPAEGTKLRKHAIQVLTMQHSGRGGDRAAESPLVSIDNRNAGGYSLREMLDALRTPPQKEEIN
jgi:hypothetical protein